MKEKHASREGMTWLEMDVLDLQFGEDEFDLVLDKGQSQPPFLVFSRFEHRISKLE